MSKVLVTIAGGIALLLLVMYLLSPPDSQTPIHLTYWTHSDQNRTQLENRLIQEFQEQFPYVSIERRTFRSEEISQYVFTALSAGVGPDIFNMQIEQGYQFVPQGNVAPVALNALGLSSVQDLISKYRPGVLDPVRYRDNIYGLPLELTNWAIYLNKRMFRDVGLDPERDYPRTWEDVLRLSSILAHREGNQLVRRGFDFRYTDHMIAVIPMVEQLGGALVNEDRSDIIINEEAWLQVFRFFETWGVNGANLGGPRYENARSAFNRGDEVAMALSGLYQQSRIQSVNPDFFATNDWKVVPFPVFEGAPYRYGAAIYGHYYMVNDASVTEVQQYAWRFIHFLLAHPVDYLREVQIVQPTQELLESEAFQELPYSAVFASDMERSNMVYYQEFSAELQELLRDAVESVVEGRSSPERAYARLRGLARELLHR
jgi:multiple sugar transport system substrate-binding protein